MIKTFNEQVFCGIPDTNREKMVEVFAYKYLIKANI